MYINFPIFSTNYSFRNFTRIFVCVWGLFFGTLSAAPVITMSMPDVAETLGGEGEIAFAREILRSAFERIGYTLDVVTLPTERSLKMAENGMVDGELLRTQFIEKEYPALLRVPEHIMEYEFVVFFRKGTDIVNNWSALEGSSVGVVIGMKFLEQMIPENAWPIAVKNHNILFQLLDNNRADYIVFARAIGLEYLRENNIHNVAVSDQNLAELPVYTYLNKRHTNLVPRLAQALQEIKQDGSYIKIKSDFTNYPLPKFDRDSTIPVETTR
ncbi:MAG: transporter substrate-binding domain-containing protein [Pseudomonadales bacterium]|nr:transporter substrate-binding domain-containing protein [Pseudomonadales bacterium]